MASARAPRPTVTWEHTDSDINKSLAMALAARQYKTRPDGSPMSAADRVHLVRCLGIATLIAIEETRKAGPPGETAAIAIEDRPKGGAPAEPADRGALRLGGDYHAGQFPSRAHCFAASTIGRTPLLFADPGVHYVYSCTTKDGEPAVIDQQGGPRVSFGSGLPANETGLAPLLVALVIVTAGAAVVTGVCYAAQKAAQVIDRKLTEDALTERMMVSQAKAVEMVDGHAAKEREAKRTLPWSPEEIAVLYGLLGSQREIAKRSQTPLPDPFAGAVDSVERAGRKALSFAGDLGLVLAAGGLVYVASR